MAFWIEKIINPLFNRNVQQQSSYLLHFKDPINDMERSYFQYKCQMYLYGSAVCAVMSIAALPLIIFYIFKKKDILTSDNNGHKKTIFLCDGLPDNLIPDALKNKYGEILRVEDDGFSLNKQDRKIIMQLLHKYPFSWLFVLKNILKIGKYSYMIKKYNPRVIVVCNEYSFTSSMMTFYCKERGVKHINVMHGEKIFTIHDSFFHFDECYVWDIYYKELFTKLKANKNQFIISIPDAFNIDICCEKKYDYVYYLANENEKAMKIIIRIMKELKHFGHVRIRPHPRYTNMNMLYKLNNSIEIEDSGKISIEMSLARTKNVISLYSTVLNQAYYNNIPIVIDDCSNIKKYQKLIEVGYIGLAKEHLLLSDVAKTKRTKF